MVAPVRTQPWQNTVTQIRKRYEQFKGNFKATECPVCGVNTAPSWDIDRDKFKLVLLDNDTSTPFITADQPTVNLQAGHNQEAPYRFELFYPLSPKQAMLLLETSSNHGNFPLGELSVNAYNMMIAESSYEQKFSNSEEYLDRIKGTLRRR